MVEVSLTIPEEFLAKVEQFIDGMLPFQWLYKWCRDNFNDIIAIDREDIRKVWTEIEVSAETARIILDDMSEITDRELETILTFVEDTSHIDQLEEVKIELTEIGRAHV